MTAPAESGPVRGPDDHWFYCGQAPTGYRADFNSSHGYWENLFLSVAGEIQTHGGMTLTERIN